MSFVKTYIDNRGLISEQTDTQPAYTLEIRGAVSSSGFGATQPKIYSYVVGNALAGDTQYNCDFLDPGDGTGLERALAAARVSSSVYVRPGPITLDQNRIHLPLVLSASCKLIGSGPVLTKIMSNSGSSTVSQHILHMSESSELSDIYFKIVPQIGNTPATYLSNIYHEAWCKVNNVEVDVVGNPLSAQVDAIPTVFMGWPLTRVPDGVSFNNIKIAYSGTINSNSYPQTFYLYMESSSYTEPTVRPSYKNIKIYGDPNCTVQGFFTSIPCVDIDNFYETNGYCNIWIQPATSVTYPSVVQGPKINNSIMDCTSLIADSAYAANVQITVFNHNNFSKIQNTNITNCEMKGNNHLLVGAANVYFEIDSGRWGMKNVSVENCNDDCTVTDAGGIYNFFSTYTSQSYAFENVLVANCSSVSGVSGFFSANNVSMSNVTFSNVKANSLNVTIGAGTTRSLFRRFKVEGCDANTIILNESPAGTVPNLIYLGNRAGTLQNNLTSILSGSATSNYIGA